MLVFEVTFSPFCGDHGVLLNFLVAVAKYGAYINGGKLILTMVLGLMSCIFSKGLLQQDFGSNLTIT